ncbi:MAG: RNA polymerase II transcription factor SIII subunit A-domain-containing protein [Linnemannia gamsii]|nr:MAG: RNA polymerase II transcription factor SIII subunit A-domain-containing protein [Linnemannia gamsii]
MAFTGVGQRLGPGQENTLPLWESITPSSTTTTTTTRTVPSLKDLCLSTLDRYVDLLDDIGTTPYYLIESVLRKCNVKQLTRVELHTEGLSEETDELWYNHALNDFESLRKQKPAYDQSGEWRTKYQTMKKEEEEKYARISARLRQNYSQYDQEKQERRVILDPTLRPKKPLRQSGSSSWSTPTPPKKKSLFEKARMEARKITQMYNSNPYPPPRSRTISNSATSGTNRIQSHSTITGQSTGGVRPGSGRIVAPTSIFSNLSTPVALGSSSHHNQQDRTPLGQAPSKVSVTPHGGASHGSGSTGSSMSPTSPTRPAAPPKPNATSANGAIMDFFKQINPVHSQQATSSHHGLNQGGSRSPTSPAQPASKTMQMLRESVAQATSPPSSSSPPMSPKKQNGSQARGAGDTMKQVKIDGDFSWLENDDDEDYSDVEMEHDQSAIRKREYENHHHKRNHSGGNSQVGSPPAKKPMDQAQPSLDEASRQSF